jgi:hypothetical protein
MTGKRLNDVDDGVATYLGRRFVGAIKRHHGILVARDEMGALVGSFPSIAAASAALIAKARALDLEGDRK